MRSFWYSSCQSTSSALLLGEFSDGEGVWWRFREADLQSRLGEVVWRQLREGDPRSVLGDDDGIRATLAAGEGV